LPPYTAQYTARGDIATARLEFVPGADEAAIEITFSNGEPTRSGPVGLDGDRVALEGRERSHEVGFSAEGVRQR
jgi:hypothetical protein